jgi:AraC family transcriptional regulator
MKSEHITLATDRRERQINFTEMLWSSQSTQWSGFRLEKHRIGPRGLLHDFRVPDILLGVCLSGSAQMEYARRGDTQRAVVRTGNFTLLNVGEQQRSIEWTGTRETLYIRVEAAQLERYLPDGTDTLHFEVNPQYGIADPQVVRLAACMYDEALSGCPTGPAYAESLSLALAAYLLKRYSPAGGPEDSGGATTFTTVVSSRIVDYIRSRLGHEITLTELADVAGLSPHYFLQIFKNTFGMTPHRYLLSERIKEAQNLLRLDHGSISEIGLDLGFSDQSHFTRTFRRLTGTTPRRFKKDGEDGLHSC